MLWRDLPKRVKTLSSSTVPDYRDDHATIFVLPEVAGPLEAVRQEWDPAMAAQIGAHVTLAYPQEAPIADLLVGRLRVASTNTSPFRLRLGGVACFERPEGGVYVSVEDVDGGYRAMRGEVLRPPFHLATFPPHVTLVNSRTSRRCRDFWESSGHPRQDQESTIKEIAIPAFDGAMWAVLMRFALGQTFGGGAADSALRLSEAFRHVGSP